MASPARPEQDAEKTTSFVSDHTVEPDAYAEGAGGDLQVLKPEHGDHLKLAGDGKTLLIPQPSDDPQDPYNWSTTKKNLAFLPLIVASLVSTRYYRWSDPGLILIAHGFWNGIWCPTICSSSAVFPSDLA